LNDRGEEIPALTGFNPAAAGRRAANYRKDLARIIDKRIQGFYPLVGLERYREALLLNAPFAAPQDKGVLAKVLGWNFMSSMEDVLLMLGYGPRFDDLFLTFLHFAKHREYVSCRTLRRHWEKHVYFNKFLHFR
jgi:hypothetical protein